MTPAEWELASENLDKVVEAIVKENPDKAKQARQRPACVGWFVGQTIKRCNGFGLPPRMVIESVQFYLGLCTE